MRTIAHIMALSVLLSVAACSSLSPSTTPSHAPSVQQRASTLERSGRFALTATYGNNQRDAVQGSFTWHERDGRLQLDLRNPMGSTLARVYTQGQQAVLVYSDGRQEQAKTPDDLVTQVLGSPVPVAGLRDWMQGLPAAQQAVHNPRYDSAGRLEQVEQDGWRVSLQRYDELGPRLLQLHRHEASRSISVRLVIDQ